MFRFAVSAARALGRAAMTATLAFLFPAALFPAALSSAGLSPASLSPASLPSAAPSLDGARL